MTDKVKYPPVILGMYGYKLLPVHKDVFKKREYEKQKLKRIKAAYEKKMREMNRDHKGWNKDYITFTNSIN
jgi:hypothetical protein